MAEGDTAKFARELLSALHNGKLIRSPNVSEKINNIAERLKILLDELNEEIDSRDLYSREDAIDYIVVLERKLKVVMDERSDAEVAGAVGNAIRAIGTVSYAHPMGVAAFWSGLVFSTISDMIACQKNVEVKDIADQINKIFERSEYSFRRCARVIQKLDDTFLAETGWSLYSVELRIFLRQAAQKPERVEKLAVCKNVSPEHLINLVSLAQNPKAIKVSGQIIDMLGKGNMSYLSIVRHCLFGISYIQSNSSISAALQVGELLLRGIDTFRQYRQNKATLTDVANGIKCMRKQFQVLKEVVHLDFESF